MRPQLAVIALVAIALGCKPAPTTLAVSPPTAAAVTVEQFRSVDWLIGRWRGTLGDTAPFFESYRLVDDSTIEALSYVDSTFVPPGDTGWITLRNGAVRSDTNYTVTAWDSVSIHFEPEASRRNSFTWVKVSADEWTATLSWTGQDGAPKSRVYAMKRLPAP